MNVKQITKALHTLSLLSEEDYDLVLKLRALTEDEREQFRTALELQKPAGKKASKRSSKSSQSSTKSSRASGMAAQLNKQLNKRREQARAGIKDDDNLAQPGCFFVVNDATGELCMASKDNVIHDTTYLSSHPFQLSSNVPTAPTRSPVNGGVESTTQNLEASAASAHAATGGLSE